VDVCDVPLVTDTEAGAAPNVKDCAPAGATVTITIVVAVNDPDVPVIVTGTDVTVTAAKLLEVRVITLLPLVGFVENVAVTPVGKPDADSVTEPENGLTSVTNIVSVAPVPWTTDNVGALGASVKLPVEDVLVGTI